MKSVVITAILLASQISSAGEVACQVVTSKGFGKESTVALTKVEGTLQSTYKASAVIDGKQVEAEVVASAGKVSVQNYSADAAFANMTLKVSDAKGASLAEVQSVSNVILESSGSGAVKASAEGSSYALACSLK
ncbi:MAG: hypothetical protein AAGB31_05940 [Bdellovibrio sp.]